MVNYGLSKIVPKDEGSVTAAFGMEHFIDLQGGRIKNFLLIEVQLDKNNFNIIQLLICG